MKKSIGDYLVLILSIICNVLSIIVFVGNYGLYNGNKRIVIFLGVTTLFYFTFNIYLLLKYRKRSRYINIFEELNIGFSIMHSMERDDFENSNNVYDNFQRFCTSISNAFSKINGHHCGVCIKILKRGYGKNARPQVLTYCRDEKSALTRPVGNCERSEHWLDKNSDFDFIYNNSGSNSKTDQLYFFANFLPWKYNYNNTRLDKEWPPFKSIKGLNIIIRQLLWPLTYRSTIVVPIFPLFANEKAQEKLGGFLCIDSPKNIAFDKKYDIEILKGLADGIYNKIRKLK